MAVKEDWNSRNGHVTQDGITIERVFTCTWDEFNNGIAPLPRIGDFYNMVYTDIRCTDIRCDSITLADCRVTCLYSTDGAAYRREQANRAASWEETISVYLEEHAVEGWYQNDNTSGSFKVWATEWNDNGPSGADADNRPELVKYKGKTGIALIAYGSLEYFYRVISNVGKINSAEFLFTHLQLKKVPTPAHDVPANYDDTGKWMFMGCDMRPIRRDCWEYQFQFAFNKEGWNTQHGVTTDMYATFSMTGILSGMDSTDIEDWRSRA